MDISKQPHSVPLHLRIPRRTPPVDGRGKHKNIPIPSEHKERESMERSKKSMLSLGWHCEFSIDGQSERTKNWWWSSFDDRGSVQTETYSVAHRKPQNRGNGKGAVSVRACSESAEYQKHRRAEDEGRDSAESADIGRVQRGTQRTVAKRNHSSFCRWQSR